MDNQYPDYEALADWSMKRDELPEIFLTVKSYEEAMEAVCYLYNQDPDYEEYEARKRILSR